MPVVETTRSFAGELDEQPLRICYQTFRRLPGNHPENELVRGDILTVTHNGTATTFSGGQIESVDSPLGLLLSVRLSAEADNKVQTLSVVVPPMGGLPADGESTLHSLAIRTVGKTSLAGPAGVKGQLTSYTVVKLRGELEGPQ